MIQAFLQLSAPWALLFKPHYEGRLCAAGSRMCLSFSITNKRLTLYRSYRGGSFRELANVANFRFTNCIEMDSFTGHK